MADMSYYRAKELAGLPGMPGTPQRVTDKAKRENWDSRTRTGRGGGKEYALSALPEATRTYLVLAKSQAKESALYNPQSATLDAHVQAAAD